MLSEASALKNRVKRMDKTPCFRMLGVARKGVLESSQARAKMRGKPVLVDELIDDSLVTPQRQPPGRLFGGSKVLGELRELLLSKRQALADQAAEQRLQQLRGLPRGCQVVKRCNQAPRRIDDDVYLYVGRCFEYA